MPRMSKQRKFEWSIFLNDWGRITYNNFCRRCANECKQSFRAEVVRCPHYLSKRSIEAQHNTGSPHGWPTVPP